MISFPNSKINLGLNVIRKRSDGFHDIETIFYPVPLLDALEVIPSVDGTNPYRFTSTGLKINDNQKENLCTRAFQLIKNKIPGLPSVQLHLHKAIPIGAGLGGGSADAAFTLKLINDQFKLNLSDDKLIEYSQVLGSDVPFFILNKACVATGRGEILKFVELDLSGYKIVIVFPGIHIDTALAFSQLNVSDAGSTNKKTGIPSIINQPPENWNDQLTNDFEPIIFKKYPEIKEIKKKLSKAGASYCSLSGSGSSLYGLFKRDMTISLNFPSSYLIKELFL